MADLYSTRKVVPQKSQGRNTFELFGETLDGDTPVGSLAGKNNDLLGSTTGKAVDVAYDDLVYFFNADILPKDIGKAIVFSVENGNLRVQYASQVGDVVGASSKNITVGNNDLIQKLEVEMSTNFKKNPMISFPTVQRFADDYFHGNDGENKKNGVSYLFTASEIKEGKVTVLKRTISNAMKEFLATYPGQTADTLGEHAVVMPGGKSTLVKYGDQPGKSSAVRMWYDNMKNPAGPNGKNPPLTPNKEGWASMPSDIYQKCFEKAVGEIPRYVSLGDVTSPNFSFSISTIAENVGLGDFAAQYPGYDPLSVVFDPLSGKEVTARDLHERTPITFEGRVIVTYKKIHVGDSD